MKHVIIRVNGKVQGVFFRASAKQKADDLRLTGFVRNEPDGSVYLEVEGDEDKIGVMLEWCKAGGPPRGRVETVEVSDAAFAGFTEFRIVR